MSANSENSLKTKAFFITCPVHEDRNGKIYSNLQTRCNLQDMGVEISQERSFNKIQREITEFDYHGYASLLFFIELECFHFKIKDLSNFVYDAIKKNSTLKYVTKLVITYSFVEMSFGDTHWTVLFNNENKRVNFKYPSIEKMNELFPDLSELALKTFEEMPGTRVMKVLGELPRFRQIYLDLLRKQIRYDAPLIDNLVLVECVQLGIAKKHTIIESFFENMLAQAKRQSVQEIATHSIVTCVDPEIYQEVATYTATGNGGCYIYNVNPSLAIVINHQSFPNELHMTFRDGSLQDVKALQKTFQSKKITSLTISDGSLEEVQQVMEKVRTTNFTGIKNLFIIIMSHGDEGDIIYTKTGSYSIRYDIVAPLMENPTLSQVQKFVIVNACRGITDPRFDPPSKVEELRKSLPDKSSLYPCDEKLMMIFSTQKGFISLLFDEGAIFVQMFCDLFLQNFDEISMEEIGEELQELMMENIADDQIPDFGSRDGQTHSIKMELVNFFNNDELLNDLENFFKKHLKDNLLQDNPNLQRMLDERSYLRDEADRALLGIGYIDGGSKQQLTNEQKKSIENCIHTKQAKSLEGKKTWSKMDVYYEWSIDRTTGCNRLRVLKKANERS